MKTQRHHIEIFFKKIAEVMSKSDYNKDWNVDINVFELIMFFHIDEINIQSRHLFLNQSLCGLSHNDPEHLANNMLVFLMSKLTGVKKSLTFTLNLFTI